MAQAGQRTPNTLNTQRSIEPMVPTSLFSVSFALCSHTTPDTRCEFLKTYSTRISNIKHTHPPNILEYTNLYFPFSQPNIIFLLVGHLHH